MLQGRVKCGKRCAGDEHVDPASPEGTDIDYAKRLPRFARSLDEASGATCF